MLREVLIMKNLLNSSKTKLKEVNTGLMNLTRGFKKNILITKSLLNKVVNTSLKSFTKGIIKNIWKAGKGKPQSTSFIKFPTPELGMKQNKIVHASKIQK